MHVGQDKTQFMAIVFQRFSTSEPGTLKHIFTGKFNWTLVDLKYVRKNYSMGQIPHSFVHISTKKRETFRGFCPDKAQAFKLVQFWLISPRHVLFTKEQVISRFWRSRVLPHAFQKRALFKSRTFK
jgi:hypothetical protein